MQPTLPRPQRKNPGGKRKTTKKRKTEFENQTQEKPIFQVFFEDRDIFTS